MRETFGQPIEETEEKPFEENSIQMLTMFVAAILADPAFHAAAGTAMIVGAPEPARFSRCRGRS
jgi:hypothetical protein